MSWHGLRERWPKQGSISRPPGSPIKPRRRWADPFTSPKWQAVTLAQVAQALAEAGQHEQAARVADQAETIARSLTSPHEQADALAQVAQTLAEAGLHEQAARVADQAETIARSLTSPHQQADALAQVAQTLAEAGLHEQAARVADQAETIARSLTSPHQQADALAQVAQTLAETGNTHAACRAVATACAVPGGGQPLRDRSCYWTHPRSRPSHTSLTTGGSCNCPHNGYRRRALDASCTPRRDSGDLYRDDLRKRRSRS